MRAGDLVIARRCEIFLGPVDDGAASLRNLSFSTKGSAWAKLVRSCLNLRTIPISVNIFRMRIDAHQHFWHYNPEEYGWIDERMSGLRCDFLPSDLQPELERAGFDGSIAVQAQQTIEETRWLLELAAASPFILGVVGWVDLQSDNVRSQLEEFSGNPKLLGVRQML